MTNLPIGCIFCYPSPICPEGFMPCDGRELSKNAYAELYKLIGGTWGETKTTFFLPDLRGQFVRGWDDGDGVDPESGAYGVRKLGSEQMDAFQGHGHKLSISGEMSESCQYYDTKTISYGTNTISSNKSITFNSIMTQSEHQAEVDKMNERRKSIANYGLNYGLRTVSNLFDKLLNRFTDIGIKHKHNLPTFKVEDAVNSTYQQVRFSVETRPRNISLMYCIKVK